MRVVFAIALAALGTCGRPATPPVVEPGSPTADATIAVIPPEQRGAPVEATIPLYRAGAMTLRSLQGRVVVLELFAPSEERWSAAQQPWRAFAAEHATGVVLVTVAVAADGPGSVEGWDTDPPQHMVGWDPQGALALRLGVATLPTILLLDAQGREVARGHNRAALLVAAKELL